MSLKHVSRSVKALRTAWPEGPCRSRAVRKMQVKEKGRKEGLPPAA
ncbi:hypothetical protein ACMGGR_03135 [Erwinia sp. BNK-24-b]